MNFHSSFLRSSTLVTACALAAMCAGCMVGPNYVRPIAEVPASFKEANGWKQAEPQDTAARGPWWSVFNDPRLDELISQVEINNQTIKGAEARVRQARALTAASRAALFPTLGLGVSGTRTSGRSGSSVSGSSASAASSGLGGPINSMNASLDFGWELDLWGRVRRSIEAGNANTQASMADLEAAKLLAQAQLAEDYFLLRVQDATIRLLNDNVAANQRSLQLTNNQYAVGVAARADVVQAEAQLRSTQAQAVDAGIQRAQLEHAIAVLTGQPPSAVTIEPVEVATTFPAIPVELPSRLLERRPDIAAAERRTAAANAQIGVAEAAFFPSLSLSATGGFQSSTLSRLLSLPSRYWSLGPDLVQTLFDAGLRRAQTEQAIAVYDQNVANYRETVLGGFQEVEDNLFALRALEQEASVQEQAVAAARESLTITTNQYRAGTVNYLSVVVVQTATLNAERTALGILGRRLTSSVELIRALGGGWDSSALAVANARP